MFVFLTAFSSSLSQNSTDLSECDPNPSCIQNLSDIIQRFKSQWSVADWYKFGLFHDEQISDINIHWLTFPPPDDGHFYALGVLYIFLMIFGLTGNFLVVFLFTRYFVIKYPLNRSFSALRIKLCLGIAWIYGIFFAMIPVLDIGLGKYTYEGYLTSCSFDYLTEDRSIKRFIFVYFVAAWVVPFHLISFSYFNILKVVTNRTMSQRRGDSFRHVKDDDSKKQEIKLAMVVFGTVLLWFLSWTPYAIVALLGIFGQKHLITPLSSMVPALFCKTASCLNSYVYALSHPKFRAELRKICCSCSYLQRRREKNNKVWSSESTSSKICTHVCHSESNVDMGISMVGEPRSMAHPTKQLDRQETVMEMICLRPSFRNRPSSVRRLARRWSSKSRKEEEHQHDDAISSFDMVCLD
ncbi:unnamed protein product [Phaedon cochleariae]|uniref:G-protein coupled receptors family 1 profile domain-containing protein n=1 Tax=Phaedon cochleariae TaxID=80249 RepID=A0A9P0DV76_PHACE|nr:unnamed protein product [Phaedon cochleariae]